MGAPGCDDAPVVVVPRTDRAKRVTIIYPYYENPVFLTKQLGGWSAMPWSLRQHLLVIVVDDGSPKAHAVDVVKSWTKLPHPYVVTPRLFRVDVDVRWNWLAARNIGAKHAVNGWLLMSDMDHVVTEKSLRDVVFGEHDPNFIYRFSRKEHTGESIHPHPNSWLMTRDMFWKVGGYDEALSGYYGTDSEYRRRCAATAPIRILTTTLVRHEYVGDSSTTHYKRKQPEDAAVKKMIRARGREWKPKVLSFPYHEVR